MVWQKQEHLVNAQTEYTNSRLLGHCNPHYQQFYKVLSITMCGQYIIATVKWWFHWTMNKTHSNHHVLAGDCGVLWYHFSFKLGLQAVLRFPWVGTLITELTPIRILHDIASQLERLCYLMLLDLVIWCFIYQFTTQWSKEYMVSNILFDTSCMCKIITDTQQRMPYM